MEDVLRAHPAITEVLLILAKRHMRNDADAEDLFQETLRAGLERDDFADAPEPEAVRRLLGSIMNSLAANGRRAARRHTSTSYDDESTLHDEANPSTTLGVPIPNPERALLESEDEASRQATKAALRAALADEDIARQMFDLAELGIRGSAELAKRIGCSTEDVYRAQRRITYHARRLLEEQAAQPRNTRRAS